MNIVRYYDWPLANGEADDAAFCPAADIEESAESYDLSLELAGVSKDDLEVTIDGDVLSIRGARKEKDGNGSALLRRERAYGKFVRCFSLPEDADRSKTSAEFKDGILSVRLMKTPAAKPTTVEVKAA